MPTNRPYFGAIGLQRGPTSDDKARFYAGNAPFTHSGQSIRFSESPFKAVYGATWRIL